MTVGNEELKKFAKEIKQAARKFYRLRYQTNNGGNLSIRISGTEYMLVKGTNVSFEEVNENNLVVCDFQSQKIWGEGKPSKEALLHGAIYQAVPEAGAIMHCHSPYATAFASGHEELDLVTHHAELKLRGKVPVFDTHSYAVPKEYFPDILNFLKEGKNAFLLRGHGQVAIGKNMREAAYLAELVEETAQIAVLSRKIM